MNEVKVMFVGICTHVSSASVPGLPVPQRVVLVNASEGAHLHGVTIPPHHARLQIGLDDAIPLNGVRLRLRTADEASHDPVHLDENFRKVPVLTELMADLITLSPPSDAVVTSNDPAAAAAHFDIAFGTLSARVDVNDAVVVTLHAESGDPFELEMVTFDGLGTSRIPIPSGTLITVSNVDDVTQDQREHPDIDFLLHYLVARDYPTIPQVPGPIALPPLELVHSLATVGAGCSNSNYP